MIEESLLFTFLALANAAASSNSSSVGGHTAEHWEPWCMTVSNRVSQGNEHWSKHTSGTRCWNWRNHSIQTLTITNQAPSQNLSLQRWTKGAWLHLRLQQSLNSMTLSLFLKERPVSRVKDLRVLTYAAGVLTYWAWTPTKVPPSPPSPPPSGCCLKCPSPECCVHAQGRQPSLWWRIGEPGTGAWLEGAEDFFFVRDKSPTQKKCRHTDISNLKQEKIRGNRASSKATGQDYGIIKATSINSLPFLDAPQRERVKVDQVSDRIRILRW